MAASKQLYFKGPYFRQNWSLPNSIIYNIAINPISPKAFQKLIKSCKYFFAKNSIVVIKNLDFKSGNKWLAFSEDDKKIIDLNDISSKLWVFNVITISYYGTIPLSSIISRIYKNVAKYLYLSDTNMSYKKFLFLTSNVSSIELLHVIVRYDDGSIVPLEKLVETLTKVKEITISDNSNSSCFTTNTVKELLKIQHFSTINKFDLRFIPEISDIDTFFTYLKKNKHTKFYLWFQNTISESYKNRLELITDEIIETENHNYLPPLVYYFGIPIEKYLKIRSLYYGW